MKFDKNLATIHAYLCADGYVIKNPITQKQKYYQIGLRNTNLVLLKDFQTRFKQRFGLEPYITQDGRCRIGNKEIYEFLTRNFSYYSNEWTMPKLSKTNLRLWLRVFYDCEGWVTIEHRKNRNIGLDSINKKGITQIKKELQGFSIPSKLRNLEKRKLFRLLIYGKENIIRFQKEIGFLHPDKKQRLEEAINSYINLYWDFPNNPKDTKQFIVNLLSKTIRQNRIRITSVKKENLLKLKNNLRRLFKIKSKIYDRKRYSELVIKKEDKNKLKV